MLSALAGLSSLPAEASTAPDGSGSATITPSTVPSGYTGTFTLDYTAAGGGLSSGGLQLTFPDDWALPQTSQPTEPGYVSVQSCSGATASVAGLVTVDISGVTLAEGSNCLVTYDDDALAYGEMTEVGVLEESSLIGRPNARFYPTQRGRARTRWVRERCGGAVVCPSGHREHAHLYIHSRQWRDERW